MPSRAGRTAHPLTVVKDYVNTDRLNFMAIDAAGKQSQPATIEMNVVRESETSSAPKAAKSGDVASGGTS